MDLMKPEEYCAYVKKLSPPSPVWRDVWNAFWIGGLICTMGQGISQGWLALGLDPETAGTMTSVSMVFLGALLTACSLYDNLAKTAGAGTIVPITGFANSIVAAAMEFRTESITMGTCAKMFVIAGPVIVWGTVASAAYGIVYYIISVLC